MTTIMHGITERTITARRRLGQHRRHRSARRHFEGRTRLAVLRALTAAQGYLQGDFPTIEIAAQSCGSGVVYVAAAVVVLSSEDLALKDRVLSGQVSLRNAAASAKRQAAIVAAYRASSTADH